MKKKNIGILYISTGKYTIFWKDFFQTSEKFFLSEDAYQKHYFIFTDAEKIEFEDSDCVHKIDQEQLSWPYITLDRFKIFQKARMELEKMDYIYFFNGNMLFVDRVGEEILPQKERPLVMVQHPGFFNKDREEFTYECSEKSLAYIPENEGKYYFMGGLNGGFSEAYLSLVDELEKNIDRDKREGVMALWHDESHLNRYAKDNIEKIKVLDPSYGYPEGWALPFPKKIVIRDKKRYGGHDFLRNRKGMVKKLIQKVKNWW